jgi:oxygen-independent coproporphyrinogen-3 oxidase
MSRWSGPFAGRLATSLFFGGGTPSLLDGSQIAALITETRAAFAMARDAEITLEANPNDLTDRYCAALLEAGVNRLSIGAQTLDRRGLRVLGRRHEAHQTAAAVAAARAAGFTNLSVDFIYGWPGQTLQQWRSDLERILQGEVGGAPSDHLSLYGLIVEPGTPMADAVRRGILTPVGDDDAADFYELACSMLADAGWLHYEIANWSATTRHVSRHNVIYWQNGDYAGLGAGAHAHRAGIRSMNQPSPRRYIAALAAGESPVSNVEQIDSRTAMGETMMLGLRLLLAGVSRRGFLRRHGISVDDQFGREVSRLTDLGLLDVDDARLRLTPRGALLANAVAAEFLEA